MPPLKFRAWDKERRLMEPVESIVWFPQDEGIASIELFSRTGVLNPNDFVLMQSTGLFDKNGVELFEGDIVDHSAYHCRLKVEWVADATGFFLKNPLNSYALCALCQKHLAIVGNLYANPELLAETERKEA